MENTKKTAVAVGLMVVISTFLFVAIVGVLSKWQMGKEGFNITLKFKFLNDLSEGAPVKVAGGIPVGYVEKIYQKNLKTFVKLHIDASLRNKLPKNSGTKFAIYTTGLMGQKYINVSIAKSSTEEVYFKDGDEFDGIDPPSIDQMMLSFSSWFDGKNGGQILAEIMQATQMFISNLNAVVAENRRDIRATIKTARFSFSRLSTQLNILMEKLNLLSTNVSEISTKNKKDIQVMLKNLSLISRDLNLVTQRINSGRGSIGKLLTNDDLYQNANSAVRNARELMQTLKEKPWLLMYKEQ